MTEKRFTMKGSKILENNEEITAWDCYYLLIELSEENKQLKQQLQSILKLTKKIEDCTHDMKLIGDVE